MGGRISVEEKRGALKFAVENDAKNFPDPQILKT